MRAVYLHGFASGPSSKKARFFAQRFAKAGVELLIPDLAEGNFEGLTITGQLQVISRIATGDEVVLIGSSLGGYLAALHASRNSNVSRVVLLAPAFSFASIFVDALGEERLDDWRKTGKLSVFHYGAGRHCDLSYQIATDVRQYPAFPDFHQPGLIFHGIHDASVPVELSRQFASSHPNVHLRLLDSDHELINVLEPMCEETLRFLGL